MPRRMSNTATTTTGLRDLLIEAELRKYGPGSRWHLPGHHYPVLEALRAREPVVVSSHRLGAVLSAAGLPHAQFSGRAECYFMLDGRGSLTEVELSDDAR